MAKKQESAAERKAREAKVVKAKAQAELPIPEFFDEDKQLKTLKRINFPNTREGQMSYCDFMVEKWKIKKTAVEKRTDPLAKKKKRRERLLEQLSKLEEELGENENGTGKE